MTATRHRHKPGSRKRRKPGEWIDWSEIPLGTLSDAEIGRQYGLKAATVAGARRRLGIPSASGDTSKFAQKKIDWDAQPLGEVPDSIIQEKLGLKSVATVGSARQRRGIPKYKALDAHSLRRFYFDLVHAMGDFGEAEQRTIKRLLRKYKLGKGEAE